MKKGPLWVCEYKDRSSIEVHAYSEQSAIYTAYLRTGREPIRAVAKPAK